MDHDVIHEIDYSYIFRTVYRISKRLNRHYGRQSFVTPLCEMIMSSTEPESESYVHTNKRHRFVSFCEGKGGALVLDSFINYKRLKYILP